MDMRSFITSYLDATESNTPRTRRALSFSSTLWNPKWVWVMSVSVVVAAGAAGGGGHGGVALRASLGQALRVALPQRLLLGAQLVEVGPRVDAGVVPVGEHRLDAVVPHRLDGDDGHLALAGLQHFLAGTMALHLG